MKYLQQEIHELYPWKLITDCPLCFLRAITQTDGGLWLWAAQKEIPRPQLYQLLICFQTCTVVKSKEVDRQQVNKNKKQRLVCKITNIYCLYCLVLTLQAELRVVELKTVRISLLYQRPSLLPHVNLYSCLDQIPHRVFRRHHHLHRPQAPLDRHIQKQLRHPSVGLRRRPKLHWDRDETSSTPDEFAAVPLGRKRMKHRLGDHSLWRMKNAVKVLLKCLCEGGGVNIRVFGQKWRASEKQRETYIQGFWHGKVKIG